MALLRSCVNPRRLRVVRPPRISPPPGLPASPSEPPPHASPSPAPFPPVLHGGSAAPPASPPRGSFFTASRHSSRLSRCLSVNRRPRLPARPPLSASPRLIKTTTSARRTCRAGLLASRPIPLPNPGVQWTRTASLCSPLTPDVRRGCAAQSSALRVHCLQQSSSRTGTSPPQRRRLTALPAHIPRAPRRPSRACVVPASSARKSTRIQHRRRLAHFGSPYPAPSRSGHPVLHVASDPPPQAQPTHAHGVETRRETRNAQLHITSGIRLSAAMSALLRSRPGVLRRSSVASGFLNPPRFHSATPNPACSGLAQLRCARH